MTEKKVIPLKKPKKEMDFKKRVEKFEQYSKNPKEVHKIFTELGFTYVDDGCDGYCPECEKKDDCKVYPELKQMDISNLLRELKAVGKIVHEGSRNKGYWKLA